MPSALVDRLVRTSKPSSPCCSAGATSGPRVDARAGATGASMSSCPSIGRIDVYQVKRYDRSLTAAQWRKIKESYDRLVEAVAEGHVAVLNWYLVMPLDQ